MNLTVYLEPMDEAGKRSGAQLHFRRGAGGNGFVELLLRHPAAGKKPGREEVLGTVHFTELNTATSAMRLLMEGGA